MKNSVFRTRALERLYQKTCRLLQEDEAKGQNDRDIDPEERASAFVASMSGSTLTFLVYHVQERHGADAFEEFAWLMSPLQAAIFSMDAAFRKAA